jgi:succinoglycan biosynthesis transport protein ExoP
MSGLSDGIQKSQWRTNDLTFTESGLPPEGGRILQYVPARPGREKGRGNSIDWQWISQVMRRHWQWSAAFALLVIAGVTAAVFVMKPVYQPVARIEVDPPGTEMFSLPGAGSSSDPTDYLETQAKILQSDELAIQVIRKLRLDQNKQFTSSSIAPGPKADAAKANSNNQQMLPGLTPAEDHALTVFRSSLDIQRDTSSRLIYVSFASHDPNLAALVTNTFLEEFINTSYQARHDAVTQSTDWLSRQLSDIRAKMESSNRALADFQQDTGIVAVDQTQSTLGVRMSELNRQLAAAEGERIQLQALLQKMDSSNPDSISEVNNDPVIQELSKRLAAARGDLSEALVVYGANHPNVKKLQAQVGELESQMRIQKQALVASLATNFRAANVREHLLGDQVKDYSKEVNRMAQYELLRKEAEANEALYNELYAKVKEAGISAESKSSNIRWVDRARVLNRPTRPDRAIDILASILIGICGGIAVAFIRETLNTKIQTPEDVRNWLGISRVSLVPVISAAKNGRLVRPLPRSTGVGVSRPQTFMLDRPQSAESEALRALRTSVRLCQPDSPPQVLLITSSFPFEGKTTIAANLAMELSRERKTCLVDADLRRGMIAGLFNVGANRTLADVLAGSAKVDEALSPVAETPVLTVLPAGEAVPNPGELVCSDAMRTIIEELRQKFHYVVIDAPPVLPFADARAIAPLVDGVLFVGRSGITPRVAMQRSLELLAEVHSAPVLEIVLNGADLNFLGYGYHYPNPVTHKKAWQAESRPA